MKEVKCDRQFIVEHYDKIKDIVAGFLSEYKFVDSHTNNIYGVARDKKEIGIDLNPKTDDDKIDTIVNMIGYFADVRVGVKAPERDANNPKVFKIDNSHSGEVMTSSAITYMVCKQLGIGDVVSLIQPSNLGDYTDDDIKNLSSNLNYAKGQAQAIVGQVEHYMLDVKNAGKIAEATKLDEQERAKTATKVDMEYREPKSMQMASEQGEAM